MIRTLVVLLLWIGGFAPAILLSQTQPDFGKGLAPFAIYKSTDIDNVNMTNGNVYVHIPVLSYPQRGKALAVSFSATANARVWGCGYPAGTGTLGYSQSCIWTMSAYAGGQVSPGVNVVSDQYGSVGPTIAQLPCIGSPSSPCASSTYTFWNYAYYRTDGSIHYFYSGSGGLQDNGYTGGGYPAVDGSGYSPPVGTSHGLVVDRHGVGLGGSIQTDADGNELALPYNGGPTVYTDTLNRNIPDPGLGSVSAPTSNCPASAQASTAARWTVPGPSSANGGQENYYLCYQTLMPSPEFPGHSFVLPSTAPTVLVALVLPDQTYFQFGYDNFLELTEIKLPTGGTIQYAFADVALTGNDAYEARVLASRTTSDGVNGAATTHYTWLENLPLPSSSATGLPANTTGNVYVTTDPLGNDEVHYISIVGQVVNDIQTDSYQGCSPYSGTGCQGSGQLLKSVARIYQTLSQNTAMQLVSSGGSYTTQSRILSETTTLPLAGMTLVSQKVYTYVPPQISFLYWSPYSGSQAYQTCNQCGEFNQIRSVTEYDYGNGAPGQLLRQTTTYYKWEDSTPSGSSTVGAQYLASSLIDLPMYVRVVDAYHTYETDYYYDETTPVASSITTQAGGYLLGSVRGHLTSLSRSLNDSGTAGRLPKNPADPTTTTLWYNTGVPYQTVDPNGNAPTTYAYDPAYAGAYVTKTVDPIGNAVGAQYDYNTGVMTSFTGVNSASTTYSYDALRRPTKIGFPDGGQQQFTYNVTLPPGQGNVVVQDLMDTRSDQHTLVYDGFGREIETQHNTDAVGSTYVDTAYDPNGRAWKVSNPYRSKSDPNTYVFTTTSYDALGRETGIVLPDGSTTSSSYSGMPYTWVAPSGNATYAGLAKTYTDSNGHRTVWTSNALGQLGSTVENSTAANNLPALTTVYLYDSAGDLQNVQQRGDSNNNSNPGVFRSRTFGYDTLSRLTYSLNPETGAITYTYDKNSNLVTKTDARNIVTTYHYDALNRLTSKTYNTASQGSTAGDVARTPYSCYQYGTSSGNSLERLTMQWTEPPSSTPCSAPSNALTTRSISGYDARGRVLNEQQCLVGKSCSQNVPGSNTYTYDLLGHLVTFGNLLGTALFTNGYDSGGKLSSVSENWTGNVGPEFPSTLFSGATYAPHGALWNATYGTSLSVSRTYDSRMRILGETDLGTTVQQAATDGSVSLTITGGVQTK